MSEKFKKIVVTVLLTAMLLSALVSALAFII